MFGNLAEMAGLLKKAKDIKNNLGKVKAELAATEYSGNAGKDMVKAVVSGDLCLKRIVIAQECPKNSKQLEELVFTAVNAALENAKNGAQEKMSELTGGIDVPGIF